LSQNKLEMDIKLFLILLEYFGLVTGLIYVIGAILEKKWCWYFGIFATIAYGISTYHYQLYGEFALQFFYLGISFYGISQWNKTNKEDVLSLEENDVFISWSSPSLLIKTLIVGTLFSAVIYGALVYFNGDFRFWDAVTTGFGIVATYLTAKKKIENWLFWIVIDIILCVIMYLKGMPYYAILYVSYTGFAIFGFYKWNKVIKEA
jgi:nicotinamide mononucleotide transporter